MIRLSHPIKTRYVACHNKKDVYHFVEVTPDLVCTTGQPFMEDYASKTWLETKVKTFAMTEKNRVDLEIFKNGFEAELKEVIEKVI